MPPDTNGWPKYAEVIWEEVGKCFDAIGELGEKTDGRFEKVIDQQTETQVAVGKLQIQAGVWGAIAGLVPSVGVLVFLALKGVFS